MFTKFIPVALTACALSAAASGQSRPADGAAQAALKIDDARSQLGGPSLMVLGLTVLAGGPVPVPGGGCLRISPDVVTIWSPDLAAPPNFPADLRFYVQRLTLDPARIDPCGAATTGQERGGGFGNTSPGLSLTIRGGIVVRNPGDT